MRKILVLRGGALGDFIVTLPTLAALRARWPDARIELAGNATAAPLARARGLLDAVHSQHETRWSALYGAGPLPLEFAAWLASFDLVVNYWPDPDRELAQRFPLHLGQTYISAAAMPERAPAAAHYLAALRPLGIEGKGESEIGSESESTEPFFRLREGGTTSNPPPTQQRHRIAIHPGSGSPRKNWPSTNWRALVPQLPGPLMVILGEAERAQGTAPFTEAAPHLLVLESPPLEDLVVHLSQCRLFLGHDSGISHLAAACGVPCLLLFGPTDPTIWAPPAPHVHVLRADLATLSVDEVLSRALALLGGAIL
ncbi:MAG: glycosyltransferase family 9 protein [Verrucomicrobiota bacterium]